MKKTDINYKNKICCGIVTYNPDVKVLKDNINNIINQVNFIIIVDNNSKNINEIEKIYQKIHNVHLIKNKKNLGIAKALNQIFSFAKKQNYDWVLTLDQDTISGTNMVKKLSKNIFKSNIGIICPRVKYFNHSDNNEFKSDTEYVRACMTSGSLTSVKAWLDVDGFDEWMFIDYVDNDFDMKLELNNYKILRDNDAVMYHRLGEAEEKKIWFLSFMIYNHSAFRNYYYVRNSIYFIKKYQEHISVVKYILILIMWESKKLFFEDNKFKTLKTFFKGFYDGISEGCRK